MKNDKYLTMDVLTIKDTGGPEFPGKSNEIAKRQCEAVGVQYHTPLGMTLRDYFAAKAMAYTVDDCTTYSRSAEEAYKVADAMMEARK